MLRSLNVTKVGVRRLASVHHQRQKLVQIIRCSSSTANTKENVGGSSGGSAGRIGLPSAFALAGASLCAGYLAGTTGTNIQSPQSNNLDLDHHSHHHHHQHRELPNGHPRGCCSCDSPPSENEKDASSKMFANLTNVQKSLPLELAKIVGEENVLTGLTEDSSNTTFLKGARLGRGKALAIVTPTSLQDAVKALQLIVEANCVIVPQGANTGLTGGSVPREEEGQGQEQRPPVVLNMRKLNTMFPIDNGTKVVCLAGSGIATLATNLPIWGFKDRESHSTLGSTFLDPTTAAGVAFGSGGTQLRKGPAYTDRAMYAKVYQNKWGKNVVEIVNTLGIEGIEDKDFYENTGNALEQLDIYATDIKNGFRRPMAKSSDSDSGKAMASDRTYAESVCKTDESSVSRFNADTKGIDCNRSEGKVLILATVHDTFQKASSKKTFWISTSDFDTALRFRKEVCLDNPKDLPMSMEYMDRDSFDVIDRSGRVMGNLIKLVGMGSVIGLLWNVKLKIEALPIDGADLFCDKFLHALNNLTPELLPSRMMEVGKKFDHHIAMTMGDFGNGEMERFLVRLNKFQKENEGKMAIQECNDDKEEMSMTAFRFVAAPAFRTYCVGENIQGFSVDYGLPKNGGQAPPLFDENAKDAGEQPIPIKRMRYSHFGCNVVHEDLAYALGVDTHAVKYAFKEQIEIGSGGKLPAEHGHGTEYKAPTSAQNRWKKMDPLNVLNPGIGGLSSQFKYKETSTSKDKK
jgi:D-lactate dehydrogenase